MRKLYRSQKDRVLAGICGGMGEVYDIDPTLIRLVLVFLGLATGIVPLLVTYVVGVIIVPQGPLPSE
jgi:phage shock protein C